MKMKVLILLVTMSATPTFAWEAGRDFVGPLPEQKVAQKDSDFGYVPTIENICGEKNDSLDYQECVNRALADVRHDQEVQRAHDRVNALNRQDAALARSRVEREQWYHDQAEARRQRWVATQGQEMREAAKRREAAREQRILEDAKVR